MASFNADAPGKRVLGGSSLLGQHTELPYCPADFLPKSTGPAKRDPYQPPGHRGPQSRPLASLLAGRAQAWHQQLVRIYHLSALVEVFLAIENPERAPNPRQLRSAGSNQTFIACRCELNS